MSLCIANCNIASLTRKLLTVPVPFIVAAPKDTPAPIMKALEDAFTKAVKDPEYVKGVTDIKLLTTYRSSAELASYMSTTYQKVGEMLKQSGLKN